MVSYKLFTCSYSCLLLSIWDFSLLNAMDSLCDNSWVTAGTTIGSSAMYLDGSALLKSGNKDS